VKYFHRKAVKGRMIFYDITSFKVLHSGYPNFLFLPSASWRMVEKKDNPPTRKRICKGKLGIIRQLADATHYKKCNFNIN